MADDTRQPKEDLSREALTVDKDAKAFSGAQWQDSKATAYRPPENANMMPGGTQHTAGGGKAEDVTLKAAFDTVKLEEFSSIHKKPCVRDALMTGIGAGFGLGGTRALFGAKVWTVCNTAVASWVLGSVVMYNWCHHKRQQEKEGMTRAMEILSRKDAEKKARDQRKEMVREERRKAKDQEQDAQIAALRAAKDAKNAGRPWYKVW